MRFTNNIQDNPWFGPAGPAMNGGPGERDLCANRLNRYQQRNMTEAKMVKTRGYGRATVRLRNIAKLYCHLPLKYIVMDSKAPLVTFSLFLFLLQVVHHHGQASTSSMDGWAEQFFCRGETKVRPHCGLASTAQTHPAVALTAHSLQQH